LLAVPSTLCGSPALCRVSQVDLYRPCVHESRGVRWPLLSTIGVLISVDWLTSQVRYVRGTVPRRTMHASCESPCHLSAKHCFLETYLLLTAPFRTMLLTARGGPYCLGPRAHEVPVYLKVLRHSSMILHGATNDRCNSGSARKAPAVL
jgi:hypothetical protein